MNVIEHLQGLVISRIKFFKSILTLFQLEAKLAGMTLLPLLLTLGISIVLLLVMVMVIFAIGGYVIWLYTESPMIALSSLFLINVLLLFYLSRRMKTLFTQLSFEKTRRVLQNTEKKDDDESTTESTASGHLEDRAGHNP